MRLFHYTVGVKLLSMLDEGVIRTTPRKPPRPERAVAWLSSNDTYERTAMKLAITRTGEQKMLSLSEMNLHLGGVFRLAYSPADVSGLVHWSELWKASKMGYDMARRLERRAAECGASHGDWWGSFKPIPIDRATLERLDVASMQWSPVDWGDAIVHATLSSSQVLQATAADKGLVVPAGAFKAGASW